MRPEPERGLIPQVLFPDIAKIEVERGDIGFHLSTLKCRHTSSHPFSKMRQRLRECKYKNLANTGAEGPNLGFANTHPWNTWDGGYQTRHLFKRCRKKSPWKGVRPQERPWPSTSSWPRSSDKKSLQPFRPGRRRCPPTSRRRSTTRDTRLPQSRFPPRTFRTWG